MNAAGQFVNPAGAVISQAAAQSQQAAVRAAKIIAPAGRRALTEAQRAAGVAYNAAGYLVNNAGACARLLACLSVCVCVCHRSSFRCVLGFFSVAFFVFCFPGFGVVACFRSCFLCRQVRERRRSRHLTWRSRSPARCVVGGAICCTSGRRSVVRPRCRCRGDERSAWRGACAVVCLSRVVCREHVVCCVLLRACAQRACVCGHGVGVWVVYPLSFGSPGCGDVRLVFSMPIVLCALGLCTCLPARLSLPRFLLLSVWPGRSCRCSCCRQRCQCRRWRGVCWVE